MHPIGWWECGRAPDGVPRQHKPRPTPVQERCTAAPRSVEAVRRHGPRHDAAAAHAVAAHAVAAVAGAALVPLVLRRRVNVAQQRVIALHSKAHFRGATLLAAGAQGLGVVRRCAAACALRVCGCTGRGRRVGRLHGGRAGAVRWRAGGCGCGLCARRSWGRSVCAVCRTRRESAL